MKSKRFYFKLLVIMLLIFVYIAIRSTLAYYLHGILEVFYYILIPIDIKIPYPYNLSGLLLIALGLGLNAWANYTLLQKISLTEREPFHTPSTLVVEGPYKFSRNPVYLSVLIACPGLAILIRSLTFFIAPIALFILFQTWFISWEEKKLEEKFGNDYLEYKKRVRRWL